MKRNLIILSLIALFCCTANATNLFPDGDKTAAKNNMESNVSIKKTWEFYSAIQKPTAEALADESNYKFGQEAGCLYNLFMGIYVVREEVVPGDPNRRTVIRKPIIYNAVRNVEKQMSKDLKGQNADQNKIEMEFVHVLKVAISAFDSDSASFENALQENKKDSNALLEVFRSVKLTDI